MKTINIIEIDFEGEMTPLNMHQFDYLPRIEEKITLTNSNDELMVYTVMDIHHSPNDQTTLYVTINGTVSNSIKSLIHKIS